MRNRVRLALVLLASSSLGCGEPTFFDATRVGKERRRRELLAHREAFFDDQRALARLPLLAPRAGDRDAGPLFSQRIRRLKVTAKEAEPAMPALGLAAGTHEAIVDDWRHAAPSLWANVDFSWMATLGDFDYWDLEALGPAPLAGVSIAPVPNLVDVGDWVRLRLAKGLHDGDLPRAQSEVRELARLLLTTEDLGTILVGASFLGTAASARTPEVFEGPVTREDRLRMSRATFATFAFTIVGAPEEAEPDFKDIRFGRCVALHDAVMLALPLRSGLSEARLRDVAVLGRLLAEAPECRLRSLRRKWAAPDEPLPAERTLLRRLTMAIPWTRHFQGDTLLNISSAQDWFRGYRPEGVARAR